MRAFLLGLLSLGALGAHTLTLEAGAPPARIFLSPRLTGAQEVPPRDSAGLGVGILTLDPSGNHLTVQLIVTRIRNVSAVHIHKAPVGVNGPIIVDLFSAPPGGGPKNGVLVSTRIERGLTPLPASLGATLSDAERFDHLVYLLRSGYTYFNVHTNDGVDPPNTGPGDFPGGEIRGQIAPRP